MTYENWRPKGWKAYIENWGSENHDEGAQELLEAIIARMKAMGMAPELFFEEDKNAVTSTNYKGC